MKMRQDGLLLSAGGLECSFIVVHLFICQTQICNKPHFSPSHKHCHQAFACIDSTELQKTWMTVCNSNPHVYLPTKISMCFLAASGINMWFFCVLTFWKGQEVWKVVLMVTEQVKKVTMQQNNWISFNCWTHTSFPHFFVQTELCVVASERLIHFKSGNVHREKCVNDLEDQSYSDASWKSLVRVENNVMC